MENIQVCVRFRPLFNCDGVSYQNIKVLPEKGQVIVDQKPAYNFDQVFDESASNLQVFNTMVHPLILDYVRGQNLAVFTYGQTSSGKTHTMLGNGIEKGITELAILELFQLLQGSSYEVRISYLEIYMEQINDLLNSANRNLKSLSKGCKTYVEGLTCIQVATAQEAVEYFKKGAKSRNVADNKINVQSSRSHSIFQIRLTLNAGPKQINSEMNLIDLAGSEGIKNSDPGQDRFKEGKSINKSLLVLIKCVAGLKNTNILPYRESELTRVLQGCLNIKSGLAFICTVSAQYIEQTCSTLKFGRSAKKVKLRPVINEIISNEENSNLEIEELQNNLKAALDEIERIKEKKRKMKEKLKENNRIEDKVCNNEGELRGKVCDLEREVANLRDEKEKWVERCGDLEVETRGVNDQYQRFGLDDKENYSEILLARVLNENSSLKMKLDESYENYCKIVKDKQVLINKNMNNNFGYFDEVFHGCAGECAKKIEKLEDEKTELENKLVSTEEHYKKQIAACITRKDYEILGTKLKNCKKEKETLLIKSKKHEENIFSLENKINDLEKDKKGLESKISTLECHLNQVVSERNNLDYCLNLKKEENIQLMNINTPNSKNHIKPFEVTSKVDLELEVLRNIHADLQIKYQGLQKSLSNKRNINFDAGQIVDEKAREIEDIKQDNEFKAAKIDQLLHQKSQIEDNLKSASDALKKLKYENELKLDQLDKISIEKRQCEEELKVKSDKIKLLIKENEELMKKIDQHLKVSDYSPHSVFSRIDDIGDL